MTHGINGSQIDVSDHGFAGDGSGGDLAAWIRDQIDDREHAAAFVLPDGTYSWDSQINVLDPDDEYGVPRCRRFAIVGAPTARLDVDIGSSRSTSHARLFTFGSSRAPAQNVRLENLEIDIGSAVSRRDAGICRANIAESAILRDLSLTRRHRIGPQGQNNGDRHTVMVNCVEPDATARIERVNLMAGDVHREQSHSVGHAIPFASEPPHVGTNYWIDCSVAGYTDNGFYVRDGVGRNLLRGCYARNCSGALFRLGVHDTVEDCVAVMDGRELPASGTPLWLQDARGTAVRGFRIEGPQLDNDAVRVTSRTRGASIRDLYADIGDVGEYVLKARGEGGLTIENWDVVDRCNGHTREASYSLSHPGVTIRDCTHRSLGGRIPFAFRKLGATVRDSHIELKDSLFGRLGSVLTGGQVADVTLEGCRITDIGDGRSWPLLKAYRDPELHRIRIEGCDVDGMSGEVSPDLADCTHARVDETTGLPAYPDGGGEGGGYGAPTGEHSVDLELSGDATITFDDN